MEEPGRLALRGGPIEISRAKPGCIVFMADQSWSMSEPIAGDAEHSKAEALALVLNAHIWAIIQKCVKSFEEVRPYFDVAVIGYHADTVSSALQGLSQPLVSVVELEANPVRMQQLRRKEPDGAGGLVERMVTVPIWMDPIADGGTPMHAAFRYVRRLLEQWVHNHSDSFPPIIINVTDGESTDRDPVASAMALAELTTSVGSALTFNIHLSKLPQKNILFPDSDDGLPDDLARMLFSVSSILPPQWVDAARREGFSVTDRSRGFAFNADATQLVSFIDVGTRNLVDRAR